MKTNEHHQEFNERLRIILLYHRELDLDPGKSVEYHYQWTQRWMWTAVKQIVEDNGN